MATVSTRRTDRRTIRHRRRRPGPRPAPPRAGPHTVHLVDADNLIGDPRTTDARLIAEVFAGYRLASGFAGGDLAFVATGVNGDHVLAVELAWPQAAHRRRRGPDGADYALIEDATWAAASHRFARVVIGSGDHIFLPVVERLVGASIDVVIVSRWRALSRALAGFRPDLVRILPEPTSVSAA